MTCLNWPKLPQTYLHTWTSIYGNITRSSHLLLPLVQILPVISTFWAVAAISWINQSRPIILFLGIFSFSASPKPHCFEEWLHKGTGFGKDPLASFLIKPVPSCGRLPTPPEHSQSPDSINRAQLFFCVKTQPLHLCLWHTATPLQVHVTSLDFSTKSLQMLRTNWTFSSFKPLYSLLVNIHYDAHCYLYLCFLFYFFLSVHAQVFIFTEAWGRVGVWSVCRPGHLPSAPPTPAHPAQRAHPGVWPSASQACKRSFLVLQKV